MSKEVGVGGTAGGWTARRRGGMFCKSLTCRPDAPRVTACRPRR